MKKYIFGIVSGKKHLRGFKMACIFALLIPSLWAQSQYEQIIRKVKYKSVDHLSNEYVSVGRWSRTPDIAII